MVIRKRCSVIKLFKPLIEQQERFEYVSLNNLKTQSIAQPNCVLGYKAFSQYLKGEIISIYTEL